MIDRRLHVLQMVHDQGTIAAASKALHVTAPAVSQQISQLSRELGVALLERHGRNVRLTEAGLALVRHGNELSAAWEAARAELASLDTTASTPSGTLTLCGFPTAVAALLAPVAARLARSAPRLQIRIRETEAADAFEALTRLEADIAIAATTLDTPPVADPRFDQQPLLDDPFDLLVPTGHPLAGETGVDLARASADRWVVADAGSGNVDQLILVACSSAGFTPYVAHHAQEWNAVAALVGHGLGVSLIPRLAPIASDLAVVRVRLAGSPPPSRRILSCVRRGSREHPAISYALTAVHDVARQSLRRTLSDSKPDRTPQVDRPISTG